MSDNNVAVTTTVIEVISVPISNFITQVIEVHEPITTGAQGPQGIPGATSLATVTDVDLTGLTDGGLLVYNAQVAMWKPTTVLDKQVLESGQY